MGSTKVCSFISLNFISLRISQKSRLIKYPSVNMKTATKQLQSLRQLIFTSGEYFLNSPFSIICAGLHRQDCKLVQYLSLRASFFLFFVIAAGKEAENT